MSRHVVEPHAGIKSVNTDCSPKRARRPVDFMEAHKASAANAEWNKQATLNSTKMRSNVVEVPGR
jgi:hypothetical protein